MTLNTIFSFLLKSAVIWYQTCLYLVENEFLKKMGAQIPPPPIKILWSELVICEYSLHMWFHISIHPKCNSNKNKNYFWFFLNFRNPKFLPPPPPVKFRNEFEYHIQLPTESSCNLIPNMPIFGWKWIFEKNGGQIPSPPFQNSMIWRLFYGS